MYSSSLKQWAFISAPLLIMLAIVWFGFGSELDVVVYFKEYSLTHPMLTAVLKAFTDWSNPFFYVLFSVMLYRAYRAGNRGTVRFVCILLVVQIIVSVLAVNFVKHTVGRPRPGQGPYFEPMTSRGTYHSLPSGHTTEILGWALPLGLRLNRNWLSAAFGLFIGIVGFSRIYLGWHHPTDVFFGWLLGSFGGFATHILTDSTLFKSRA